MQEPEKTPRGPADTKAPPSQSFPDGRKAKSPKTTAVGMPAADAAACAADPRNHPARWRFPVLWTCMRLTKSMSKLETSEKAGRKSRDRQPCWSVVGSQRRQEFSLQTRAVAEPHRHPQQRRCGERLRFTPRGIRLPPSGSGLVLPASGALPPMHRDWRIQHPDLHRPRCSTSISRKSV